MVISTPPVEANHTRTPTAFPTWVLFGSFCKQGFYLWRLYYSERSRARGSGACADAGALVSVHAFTSFIIAQNSRSSRRLRAFNSALSLARRHTCIRI